MSERDYSRLPVSLQPIFQNSLRSDLADTLLGIMDWHDALAKRIEAIERAATCKGCGKPLLPENAWMEDGCPCNSPKGCNAPAQTNAGEASAESEWPRYFENRNGFDDKTWMVRFDDADTYMPIYRDGTESPTGIGLLPIHYATSYASWREVPRSEAEARIAAANGEGAAVPLPAPVDQGQPSEGRLWEYPKDEIERLKSALATATAEVERLKVYQREHEAAELDAADLATMRDGTKLSRRGLVMLLVGERENVADLNAKLAEAILLWQEAAAKAESFRKAACIESEKRVAEWHEKERGNDPTGT